MSESYRLLRFRRWLGLKLKPHEKALLGDAPWGRQNVTQSKAKATIGIRVYRIATGKWEKIK